MPIRERLGEAAHAARVLGRSGALAPGRPARVIDLVRAVNHWGVGLAAAFATGAARYADRPAIADERGSISYRELDEQSNAIARGLAARGVRAGDRVGVMCRNSRHFFEITAALAKVGADALYLNTGFAAPQLRDVVERERGTLVVLDDEFAELVAAAGIAPTLIAWSDARPSGIQTLDELAARYAAGPRPTRPTRESRTIILTSGTTGAPKGAARQQRGSATSAIGLLERVPYRAGETMVLAAPCFHAWGLANAMVGLLLGDTLVLERHFDPERAIASIARHHAEVLAAVPVMLLRMLEVPDDARRAYDTSSLRLVPLSGSALPGELATHFMDAFGDVVYNLYGSTEVGSATIATPADLRAAPTTAGRPLHGTEIRLLDGQDKPVPPGTSGRIFVRNGMLFDGYTDGGSKPVIDGFMATGDTGHLDAAGRLFIDGRDDDMIVSGGEKVFPVEVEHVITELPDVVEAVVIGIPDDEFGQRLKAFVVRRPDATIDSEAVREYVRSHLARFKVPREVEFVADLPRNATGKVVTRDLA